MAYSTHFLICKPVGQGWSIRDSFKYNGLVLGKTIMQKWMHNSSSTFGGLSKWLKDSGRDTYQTDTCLVYAVYLYQLEAPGEWCQIFWECHDEASANKLKEKLLASKCDISGDYLVNRCLSDLTREEIKHYQTTVIDA